MLSRTHYVENCRGFGPKEDMVYYDKVIYTFILKKKNCSFACLSVSASLLRIVLFSWNIIHQRVSFKQVDSRMDLCNRIVRDKENVKYCGRQQSPIYLSSLVLIVFCCFFKDLCFSNVRQIPGLGTWAALRKPACKLQAHHLLRQQIVKIVGGVLNDR